MPQRYKIFYTSTAERDITEKLMYIMQQYRNTVLAEQENLTAFPAKYPLYDVEPWSKTKRAAIAALFCYHKPLISRPDKLRRFILLIKSKEKPLISKKQAVLHGTPGAIRTHGLWSRSGEL